MSRRAPDVSIRLVAHAHEVREVQGLLCEVAHERGWPAERVVYGHEAHSLYWGARLGREWVGAVQVVRAPSDNLPITETGGHGVEAAWPGLRIEDPLAAEVAMVSVTRTQRGNRSVLLALLSAMSWHLRTHGTGRVCAILDPVIHALYRRMGLRFTEMGPDRGGGRKIYWGEETFPAVLELLPLEDMLAGRPDLWPFLRRFEPGCCPACEAAWWREQATGPLGPPPEEHRSCEPAGEPGER